MKTLTGALIALDVGSENDICAPNTRFGASCGQRLQGQVQQCG